MANKHKLEDKLWKYSLEIPLTSERHSNVIFNTLCVDREPRQSEISRELEVKGNILYCHWKSTTPQLLRVSVNSFFNNIALVLDAIENFDTAA